MEKYPVLPRFEGYLADESRLGGQAEFVLQPSNCEELAAAMHMAAGAGAPVTLQGGRTGLAGGAVPDGGWIVSCEKLGGIEFSEAADGTPLLHVGAGVTLGAAEDALRAQKALHGYRVPFNPTEKTATMGGLFATNAAGANALRLGHVGRHTTALTWVTPTGSVWNLRRGEYQFTATGCPLPDGRILPYPAGLPTSPHAGFSPREGDDLLDFLAGSEGRLGAACTLQFALIPRPAEYWGVLFFFPQDAALQSFVGALGESAGHAYLEAAEYYDETSLALIDGGRGRIGALNSLPPFPPGSRAALYLELAGDDPAVLEEALVELLGLFSEGGGSDEETWAVSGETEGENFRAMRHALPELCNTEVDALRPARPGHTKLACDFTGNTATAGEWCNIYHKGLAEAGLRGAVFGHILENHLHVNLLPQNEAEHTAAVALAGRWADAIVQEGGQLASESGIGRLKWPLVWQRLPAAVQEAVQNAASFLGGRIPG